MRAVAAEVPDAIAAAMLDVSVWPTFQPLKLSTEHE